MLRFVGIVVALAGLVPRASADELSSGPDRELAERNFRIGSEHYENTDYTGALQSFQRARASYPSSALDYNVARCLDRLDRPEQAIVEYERYLGKTPHGASADDVRARVIVLRKRLATLAAELAARSGHAPKPIYKRWWLWTSITVATAAGVAIGLGIGLTASSTPSATTDYGTVRFPVRSAIAAVALLCACGAPVDGLTVVHVTATAPIEGVARLSIAITDGEHTLTEDLGNGTITLPPERTFSIETPSSFAAELGIKILALDANGLKLAAGQAQTHAISGRRVDVTVTLDAVHPPPLPDLAVAEAPSLTVVAGNRGGPGYANQLGGDARFRNPAGVVCDPVARVCYVADTDNHVIRRLALDTGQLTTIAGRRGVAAHVTGMLGTNALHSPVGLALDAADSILFIVERDAHCIDTLQLATGTLQDFFGTPDMPGATLGGFLSAQLRSPEAIAIGAATNTYYVSDTGNHVVLRVVAGFAGPVSEVLGGQSGNAGFQEAASAGATSLWNTPRGLATTGSTLYVADAGNHRVRAIDASVVGKSGATTTLAGGDTAGGGDGAPGTLHAPSGIALLGSFAYIADPQGPTVRALDLSNLAAGLTTLAGQDGTPGSADGAGSAAGFVAPSAVATVGSKLVIADAQSVRGIDVSPSVLVTTLAGRSSGAGPRDGIGEAAGFARPRSLVTDGTVAWIADADNAAIRRVDLATQAVTTLAGQLGLAGHADGPAGVARFDGPSGLAYDGSALWVAEEHGQLIRRVDVTTGETSTVAGAYAMADHVDGAGDAARFDGPLRPALVGTTLYLIERGGTLRAIDLADPAFTVRTVAGAAGVEAHVDGPLADARFESPNGLVADGLGRLYVSEDSGTLRRVDLTIGAVFTFAGAYRQPGLVDSCGVTAHFLQLHGIDLDYEGARLLVSDGHFVRRVSLTDACVSTIGGHDDSIAVQLGPAPASFNQPGAIARGADGALFVLDEVENVLLRLRPEK